MKNSVIPEFPKKTTILQGIPQFSGSSWEVFPVPFYSSHNFRLHGLLLGNSRISGFLELPHRFEIFGIFGSMESARGVVKHGSWNSVEAITAN